VSVLIRMHESGYSVQKIGGTVSYTIIHVTGSILCVQGSCLLQSLTLKLGITEHQRPHTTSICVNCTVLIKY